MKQFNVLVWDINANKVVPYNVLPYFRDKYESRKKSERPKTREEWKKFVERWGKYQYWARCEYEILILPWPSKNEEVKIDVWDQIEMNIDTIVDLLMEEK